MWRGLRAQPAAPGTCRHGLGVWVELCSGQDPGSQELGSQWWPPFPGRLWAVSSWLPAQVPCPRPCQDLKAIKCGAEVLCWATEVPVLALVSNTLISDPRSWASRLTQGTQSPAREGACDVNPTILVGYSPTFKIQATEKTKALKIPTLIKPFLCSSFQPLFIDTYLFSFITMIVCVILYTGGVFCPLM